MPSVNSLRKRFENNEQAQPEPASTQRVRVTRYSMPLRQSTLSFGAPAVKRQSLPAASPRVSMQAPTPPAEESEGDTIVVNTASQSETRVHLPTPSESATDASSQASATPQPKSPVRSRSKRVSSVKARKSTSKEELIEPATARAATATEKQRNISGETLVAYDQAVVATETTLLKESIDALDMTWNMSVHFQEPSNAEDSESSSTITVAVDEPTLEIKAEQQAAKRVKKEAKDNKWEARRRSAEKNASRRSGRASTLLNKASEVVSAVKSTVLGKRKNDAATIPEEDVEPDLKKVRVSTSSSVSAPARSDDKSLSTTNRAMKSRGAKDKKWLTSGLYAGQTRAFDPKLNESKNKRKSTTATDLTISDAAATLPPKENTLLPLPMFAGDRLLTQGRDFKLPFDIFSPLPPGHPKPDEYRKVNKNVFIGDAAEEWREMVLKEHSTCMCSSKTGCDDNCFNRLMYYECDSHNCNLTAESCGNRAFAGLKERVKKGGKFNVGVEVVRTDGRGYGVRANRCFEPGQIIVEYTGEIITQEECERRMRTDYKDNECYYLMAFDQNMIIDATRGSLARFVNHSCSPNCKMEKWTVNGKPRMALFAGDSGIMTGEELTYDYNFDPYSQKNVQVCRCGSANCRGVLGPKPKEGTLAGMKRKLEEVLGLEGSENENGKDSKKLKKEKPKLPKGWAYVEPLVKPTRAKKVKIDEGRDEKGTPATCGDEGTLSRQPSKLKRMLSGKSSKTMSKRVSGIGSVKRRGSAGRRIASGASQKALIEHVEGEDQDGMDVERPSTGSSAIASLKSKAGSLKRTMSRGLRGGN